MSATIRFCSLVVIGILSSSMSLAQAPDRPGREAIEKAIENLDARIESLDNLVARLEDRVGEERLTRVKQRIAQAKQRLETVRDRLQQRLDNPSPTPGGMQLGDALDRLKEKLQELPGSNLGDLRESLDDLRTDLADVRSRVEGILDDIRDKFDHAGTDHSGNDDGGMDDGGMDDGGEGSGPGNLGDALRDQIKDAVRAKIEEVLGELGDGPGGEIGDSIKDAIRAKVDEILSGLGDGGTDGQAGNEGPDGSEFAEQIKDAIRAKIEEVLGELGDGTGNPGSDFRDQIREAVRTTIEEVLDDLGDGAGNGLADSIKDAVRAKVDEILSDFGDVGPDGNELADEIKDAVRAKIEDVLAEQGSGAGDQGSELGETISQAVATKIETVLSKLHESGGGNIDFSDLDLPNGMRVIDAAGSLIHDGSVSFAESAVVNRGTVGGNLTIETDLFINDGTLRPGNSPGEVTIDGDFVQTADGLLEIEIAGLTPGLEHDVLNVTGDAYLAGELEISFIDDFVPQNGDEFAFMNVDGSLLGEFDTITIRNLADGLRLNLIFDGNSLRAVVNNPEPASIALWSLLGLSAAITIWCRRK